MRDPQTPDCAIRGCTKAIRRLGMCEEHGSIAPYTFGVRAAMDAMTASRRAALKVHREAQAYVRKELRARAA